MSDSENEDKQEPKIVIDTDWKEQVAREKEASGDAHPSSIKEAPEEDDEAPEADDSNSPAEDDGSSDDEKTVDINADNSNIGDQSEGEMPPPPPASFDVLISMLFTQSMAFLGQMPDPASGKTTVNKPYAKHYIDTLDMLSEKTKGNLSDNESKMLSEALHALRMMYVNAKA